MQQDAKFSEIGASLRDGRLYVKVPYEKVLLFIGALEAGQEDLLRKEIHFNPSSRHQPWIFAASVEDWKKDHQTLFLLQLSSEQQAAVVAELCWTVEQGFSGNPSADWLSRTGHQ